MIIKERNHLKPQNFLLKSKKYYLYAAKSNNKSQKIKKTPAGEKWQSFFNSAKPALLLTFPFKSSKSSLVSIEVDVSSEALVKSREDLRDSV